MLRLIRPAFGFLLVFTVLTGVVYPLVVTAVARAALAEKADGSLVYQEGKAYGSALIGQPFAAPQYFWARPSATTPSYNAGASSGSNLGPLNPALADAVAKRVAALRSADPSNTGPVPVDLVTASASGLDPHISPAAALYQVRRVARARLVDPDCVRLLVERRVEGRTLGILGEPKVNVLLLNLALDRLECPTLLRDGRRATEPR
jgi:potassium-transporting ATPase KdpC subunit